jgi:hypothetical protein
VQSETRDVVTPILKALNALPFCVAERMQSGTARGGKTRLATAGSPDIWAVMGGVPVLIECKRRGKKPTDVQSQYHDRARRAGAFVLVATNPGHAIDFYKRVMAGQEAAARGNLVKVS